MSGVVLAQLLDALGHACQWEGYRVNTRGRNFDVMQKILGYTSR
jgi:hypothetical protein